jgi:hypothetical protein
MGERLSTATRKAKENIKKPLAVIAIGTTALAAAGCGNEMHTLSEAKQIAANKYAAAWNHASPAGKFLMQYLRVGYADVTKHRGDGYGPVESLWRFTYNDGCLGGTSYDIAGGEFDVSASAEGFLSSVSVNASGRIPAAAASAYVSDKNPDILRVQSGHDHPHILTFSGLEGNGSLAPATQETENVLNTWG